MAINETKALKLEMAVLQEFFLSQQTPVVFSPYQKDNAIMEGERSFEAICITLSENGMSNPKKMTEFEFYSSIVYFQKKYEDIKNASKH